MRHSQRPVRVTGSYKKRLFRSFTRSLLLCSQEPKDSTTSTNSTAAARVRTPLLFAFHIESNPALSTWRNQQGQLHVSGDLCPLGELDKEALNLGTVFSTLVSLWTPREAAKLTRSPSIAPPNMKAMYTLFLLINSCTPQNVSQYCHHTDKGSPKKTSLNTKGTHQRTHQATNTNQRENGHHTSQRVPTNMGSAMVAWFSKPLCKT